jgi:hypothetical protein
MSNKRQQLLDQIFNRETPVQVYPAEVVSVQGATCTVRLLSSGMEVDEVRLFADVEASDRLVLTPAEGSTVLVGLIENDLASLYVAQYSEVEDLAWKVGEFGIRANKDGIEVTCQNTTLEMTAQKAVFDQAGTKLEMQAGRVKITNGAVSLKDLFSDLATLLNTLIVVTPAGPSTALGPNSIIAVTQLTAKVNQLLS